MLTSVDSVDAINVVFWNQSFGIKMELLRSIERESLIDADTADAVFEMVANCMKSRNYKTTSESLDLLSSLMQFRSLSTKVLRLLLDNKKGMIFLYIERFLSELPLDRLLELFWVTHDSCVEDIIGKKLILASVTCIVAQGGKTIVSVIEKGKKTVHEAPIVLVQRLISQGKDQLCRFFGDLFS